jgi:PITH domain
LEDRLDDCSITSVGTVQYSTIHCSRQDKTRYNSVAMDFAQMTGGGGGGAPEANNNNDTGKLVDLSPKIASQECWAKNVDTRFPMTNLFIGDTRLGCKSDADEQLILHVSFQEFVKVRSRQRLYSTSVGHDLGMSWFLLR